MIAPFGFTCPRGKESLMDEKTFGARLKELREATGLSQRDLAAKIGTSQKAISHWEQGQREPGWFNCIALAKALGISLDVLATEPAEVPEPKRGRPKKQ